MELQKPEPYKKGGMISGCARGMTCTILSDVSAMLFCDLAESNEVQISVA